MSDSSQPNGLQHARLPCPSLSSCMDVKAGPWRKLRTEELTLLICGAGEDSWESLGQQGDQINHPKGNQPWIWFSWKTIALTRQTFVGKVMPLLFNMLSRFVIPFLPSKDQVSFNYMVAVTVHSSFVAQENKICHCFLFFLLYLPWSDIH